MKERGGGEGRGRTENERERRGGRSYRNERIDEGGEMGVWER